MFQEPLQIPQPRNGSSSHVGSEDGFLPGAELIYRAITATGDYHGLMNASLFKNYMVEKVLPNLPSGKVVLILDNAPYHSTEEEKVPNRGHKKQVMIDWLQRDNIPCSDKMRKCELFDLIRENKPRQKKYEVDELFRRNGVPIF